MKLRRKPSGIWAVDFDDPVTGKRRRESCHTRDETEARKNALAIIRGTFVKPAEMRVEGIAPHSSDQRTMSRLFDECLASVWRADQAKAQRTIHSNLRILTPLIGKELVASVTEERLNELQKALFAKGYKPATVKRKLDTVGKALTMACKWKWIAGRPPLPQIKVQNGKDRVITPAEERAMFAAIERRMTQEPSRPWRSFGTLVRFLLDTGCRLSEPLQADLSWFRVINGRHYIAIPGWATKTGKPRKVPLTRAVIETLPYLRATAVSDKPWQFTPARVWYMFSNIKDDLKEAGHDLSDVVLHTFRHTCITRLLERGLRIHQVSRWAGHADIKITIERYGHLAEDDLDEGADALDALAAPATPLSSVNAA